MEMRSKSQIKRILEQLREDSDLTDLLSAQARLRLRAREVDDESWKLPERDILQWLSNVGTLVSMLENPDEYDEGEIPRTFEDYIDQFERAILSETKKTHSLATSLKVYEKFLETFEDVCKELRKKHAGMK